MRRVTVFAVALATLLSACGAGRDRYEPKFGAAETIANPDGPITFVVTPASGNVYYAELRDNEVFVLVRGKEPRKLFTTDDKPDSIAVGGDGSIYIAARTTKHRLSVARYREARPEVIWNGPVTTSVAHLAVTANGELVVGLAEQILRLDPDGPAAQTPSVISRGWTDPVLTAGRDDRIWVADNAAVGETEKVARGRESDIAKRNRFATGLPGFTNPSGMTLLVDELLVCSKTKKRVFRLHIGIDDVARRRDWMDGLVCDRDIGVMQDGSLVTATKTAIYRYPPR